MSGATDYSALCSAAHSEERRQAELDKRKKYQSSQQDRRVAPGLTLSNNPLPSDARPVRRPTNNLKCFTAGSSDTIQWTVRNPRGRALVRETQGQRPPTWCRVDPIQRMRFSVTTHCSTSIPVQTARTKYDRYKYRILVVDPIVPKLTYKEYQ